METIKLFKLFLSTPSDVAEERVVISGLIDEWNVQHGGPIHIRVELIHWSTHTFPTTGRRAQAAINQQAFDKSDIVVGIFWSRFGTPTGHYGSGTEEELRRGIAQKKQVMVYFSRCRAPKTPLLQYSKIEAFKRKLGKHALYCEYSDLHSFEQFFRNHLALVMQNLQKKAKRGK